MKKILFAFACMALATVGAQAQKLGFVNKDGVVADGSTVVCNAGYNIFGLFCCETGSLALKNYTDDNISCVVTVECIDNTMGSMPEICMGGSCEGIKAWPFERAFTCSASKSVIAQYEIAPSTYGELNSLMTVTGGGETHSVYIKFAYPDPAGIDDAAVADGKCTVYDLQGNLVAANMAASEVMSLKHGLYIVRTADAKQVSKVLVR